MKHFIGAFAMTTALAFVPTALASSEDEAAVKTIVESVGSFADRAEFDALERLYAPEVTVDYSSLNGRPADIKSAKGLMTEWASVLPGFDRTRHALSDVSATIKGDTATATANVIAGHWINGTYWEVEGRYTYKLEETADQWTITSMTFTLEGETGSRDVFGPAIEAAAANPVPYLQRQQTRAAVMDFLNGLEQKDMAKVNAVWAEDAVQAMPYVPESFPSRVVGKSNLIAHYADWPINVGDASFTDGIIFHDTTDTQAVFVEFKCEAKIIPTGLTYRQTCGGLFHVENGKITLFREYFDPREFKRAFGL